jgi:4-hydroxybutyryl-CoA dehydratase/vinylacetyl-CoA-Delta-isomerase
LITVALVAKNLSGCQAEAERIKKGFGIKAIGKSMDLRDCRSVDTVIQEIAGEFGMVGGEALVIFDDVFVPWERVFMSGEVDFTGVLVERFATLHRQNYGGCKGGLADIIIGASALAAQYQGTLNASHIKDKLVEMLHLAETVYSGSVACSAMGSKTKSGAYYPDPLLANCTKHNITRNIYEVSRLAYDIGGGILATLPFDTDLRSPEIGKEVCQKIYERC